jgi:hypothetical protein
MYMLNLTIGYFLMNIAMCYYSGHFLAIIFGFTFGYYVLHVTPPPPVHSLSSATAAVEACHQKSNYGSMSFQPQILAEEADQPGPSQQPVIHIDI